MWIKTEIPKDSEDTGCETNYCYSVTPNIEMKLIKLSHQILNQCYLHGCLL